MTMFLSVEFDVNHSSPLKWLELIGLIWHDGSCFVIDCFSFDSAVPDGLIG